MKLCRTLSRLISHPQLILHAVEIKAAVALVVDRVGHHKAAVVAKAVVATKGKGGGDYNGGGYQGGGYQRNQGGGYQGNQGPRNGGRNGGGGQGGGGQGGGYQGQGGGGQGGGCNNGGGNGGGGRRPRVRCQIYGIWGHEALSCRNRFNQVYQADDTRSGNAASTSQSDPPH
jgi:hypothetical protein